MTGVGKIGLTRKLLSLSKRKRAGKIKSKISWVFGEFLDSSMRCIIFNAQFMGLDF